MRPGPRLVGSCPVCRVKVGAYVPRGTDGTKARLVRHNVAPDVRCTGSGKELEVRT